MYRNLLFYELFAYLKSCW